MEKEHTGRHFTVAVCVEWEGKVLLRFHRKLGIWLPPLYASRSSLSIRLAPQVSKLVHTAT
ncbi:MAG: hypothetical protein M3M97_03910 [Actinomycetota bacterium]|nr:hypothetical protein [Actinomycetota bacterium]